MNSYLVLFLSTDWGVFFLAKLGQVPRARVSERERGENHMCLWDGGGKMFPGFLPPRSDVDPGWGG